VNLRDTEAVSAGPYRIHPHDIFRRTNMSECMGAIDLVCDEGNVSRVAMSTNEYLEKAPGKVDGNEERIPVQDEVRNL